MSLILSGTDGVSDVDGTAATPALRGSDTNTGIFFPAADTIAFSEGGVESARFDSAGNLGIGTSSPSGRLDVAASGNTVSVLRAISSGSPMFYIAGAGGGTPSIAFNSSQALRFAKSDDAAFTNFAELMRLDPSGNLGLGVTPSPWSGYRVLQAGIGSFIGGASGAYIISDNAYTDNSGATWRYINSGYAPAQYFAASGAHVWRTAGSGTAGNAISWTQAMTLDSGGLFVNPQSLSASYTGFLRVTRSSTNVGQAIASFQQDAVTSSEDFNLISSSASYTNASTLGWGMQRIIAFRSASSVFNFLTCTTSNGGNISFYLRGDGNAYADGTWNNNGADYAEYFESASGQEIPVGTSVVLDGNKVRPATSQDTNILGVVRPKKDGINSMVVGNTAWGGWANKYLQDDFGCFIMEDYTAVEWAEVLDEWEQNPDPANGVAGVKRVKNHSYATDEVPEGVVIPPDAVYKTHDSEGVKLERRKINPAWDPNAKYVPREKRPEWLIVGLLGQIRILKGQPVGPNWVKMRDISASVEEWFVK